MMEPVIRIELNAVKLRNAVLCANCDVISDSPHDNCLVCGSPSLLPLSRVLGNVNAISRPAAHQSKQEQTELPNNVLVLMSPMAHRSRQRGRR